MYTVHSLLQCHMRTFSHSMYIVFTGFECSTIPRKPEPERVHLTGADVGSLWRRHGQSHRAHLRAVAVAPGQARRLLTAAAGHRHGGQGHTGPGHHHRRYTGERLAGRGPDDHRAWLGGPHRDADPRPAHAAANERAARQGRLRPREAAGRGAGRQDHRQGPGEGARRPAAPRRLPPGRGRHLPGTTHSRSFLASTNPLCLSVIGINNWYFICFTIMCHMCRCIFKWLCWEGLC